MNPLSFLKGKEPPPKTVLPIVPTTTIVWFDQNATSFLWDSALGSEKGDKKKGDVPLIELNLVKMLEEERQHLADSVMRLVQSWVSLQILVESRYFLSSIGVREDLSYEGERDFITAIGSITNSSPKTYRYYVNRALSNILRGEWKLDNEIPNTYPRLLRLLEAWLEAGSDITDVNDAFFLQSVYESIKANGGE